MRIPSADTLKSVRATCCQQQLVASKYKNTGCALRRFTQNLWRVDTFVLRNHRNVLCVVVAVPGRIPALYTSDYTSVCRFAVASSST